MALDLMSEDVINSKRNAIYRFYNKVGDGSMGGARLRGETVDKIRFAPATLAAANINPTTRLATDYLNHFNTVVMLLELIEVMPECADEVLAWQPRSYIDYFAISHFREKELAMAAYASADSNVRARFETVVASLDQAMIAACDLLRDQDPTDASVAEAVRTAVANQLKPLIAAASGIINCGVRELVDVQAQAINRAQYEIDELFP